MEPEITFLVTYRCPRCDAALTAQTEQWSTWLRCPNCGRAALPPDYATLLMQAHPMTKLDDGIFLIGGGDSPPLSAVASNRGRRASALTGSLRRLFLVSGLFLSLLILLFSFLDQNTINASIFGFAALVFLGFLLVPTRR